MQKKIHLILLHLFFVCLFVGFFRADIQIYTSCPTFLIRSQSNNSIQSIRSEFCVYLFCLLFSLHLPSNSLSLNIHVFFVCFMFRNAFEHFRNNFQWLTITFSFFFLIILHVRAHVKLYPRIRLTFSFFYIVLFSLF